MTTPTDVTPAPDPSAPVAPTASLVGQITLTLTALATIVAFIWHKDYSSLVPALGTVATALIGAALAIEHAIKYRTFTRAQLVYNDQRLSTHVVRQQATNIGTALLPSVAE